MICCSGSQRVVGRGGAGRVWTGVQSCFASFCQSPVDEEPANSKEMDPSPTLRVPTAEVQVGPLLLCPQMPGLKERHWPACNKSGGQGRFIKENPGAGSGCHPLVCICRLCRHLVACVCISLTGLSHLGKTETLSKACRLRGSIRDT